MDSWNSDAFDSELRSVLNRHSELIVAYHSEDSCLMFEHLNSDPYESLKSNKFSQEYIRFLEKTVVPLVSYRRVRVWHYTRLLDEEANAMSEQLEASTLDRLKRRLSFLVEKCLIEEGDANTIFQQSVFHSQASGRSCRFWTTRDLCITLILAKIWEFTIDFIVKNLMKFAKFKLCRGLYYNPATLK
jgi:hypothetical protein